MDFKLLGSILLIVGTCVGAGMLALPIATAQLGFGGSLILLFACWFVMTAGAFLILEVNLWLPLNSNIISMARATIGPVGQVIAWINYLLLLYSLLCAYIAGGSDLFHNLLNAAGINLAKPIAAIVFTLVFGAVVYLGIRSVDYVNRGLMITKFSAYVILVVLLFPLISSVNLADGDLRYLIAASAIVITVSSFGFATIIPSLRIYLDSDVRKLKQAIFIGSLIPLICYIFWDAAIMGVIPLNGEHSLMAILKSQSSTSDLVNTLSYFGSQTTITFFVKLFTSICVLTSFLGVSLCLTDFMADGFNLEKKGKNNLLIQLIVFIPPLLIVLVYPNAFISALEYAGIYSIVLLILLPAWMAWRGRYTKKLVGRFQVFGGATLLVALIVLSLAAICWSLYWSLLG